VQTIRVQVTGRVQGVCFRESTRLEGNRLGLTGWVKNRLDGSVEAMLQGDERDVFQMLVWMKSGPQFARVDNLVTEDVATDEVFSDFTVRYGY